MDGRSVARNGWTWVWIRAGGHEGAWVEMGEMAIVRIKSSGWERAWTNRGCGRQGVVGMSHATPYERNTPGHERARADGACVLKF